VALFVIDSGMVVIHAIRFGKGAKKQSMDTLQAWTEFVPW
jgi:hypothetical protein